MNVQGNIPPADRAATEADRLALIGHDLRAAVSDVIGGLRLIDHEGLDEAQRLQFERVRSSGEVLARLIEESLSILLGDTAPEPDTSANVQLARLVYDLEMRWSGRASEKGLAFRVAVAPGVPRVILTDRIALERVLANLLSNAVKYTDVGAVDFVVELAADGALRFVVTDNGPGFSPAALDRLFQFAARPEGTAKPGHGLGMFISKDMTGRLGGHIAVTNLAQGGAEVVLSLPHGTWSAAAAHEAEPGELPDLSQTKVLVAEDNPTIQSLLKIMLGRMGAEYCLAVDGVEAMHWLERERFDVALIDIEMPRLSGLDVIRAIRGNERLHAKMPVIAVTAYVRRAERETIYAAGADSILPKPLPAPEAIALAIAAALGRKAPPAAASAAVPDNVPELDRAKYDHLIDIAGPDAARELMERLARDLGSCRAGLARALDRGDNPAIRAETHVLIALAGAVGATRLQRAAEALNLAAHRRDGTGSAGLAGDCLDLVDKLVTFVAAEAERAARQDASG
jgi:CheY-like chemotaxis protein/DNA-binding phage protein